MYIYLNISVYDYVCIHLQILRMETSASLAKTENNQITSEFESRERKCFDLIREQQESYEKLTKMKVNEYRLAFVNTYIYMYTYV
jgi:hypothetical protein